MDERLKGAELMGCFVDVSQFLEFLDDVHCLHTTCSRCAVLVQKMKRQIARTITVCDFVSQSATLRFRSVAYWGVDFL